MERKTLTEWPTSPLQDAIEWWLYMAAPDYVGIPGRFRYDDHGRIVFECEDGTALGAGTFEDGERFEPCEAPNPDPRIAALEGEVATLKARIATLLDSAWDPWPASPERLALEAENAALKASAEANADAVSEHAAISALMAADPVLCRHGVLEAFEMLKARADEACEEPAPLRLGRGPTLEEVETVAAKESDGLGWWLLSFDGDAIVWEVCSLHVECGAVSLDSGMGVFGFGDITDAIPLNASRQPCGVGVKS